MSKETTSGERPNNRKPRYRSVERQLAQKMQKDRAIELAKGIASNKTTIIGVQREIAAIMGITLECLEVWVQRDAEFNRQFRLVIENAKLEATGNLAGILPQAVEVIKETVTGVNTSPLRFDAAHKTVKGFGVLQGDGGNMNVAVQVINQPPQYIELRNAEPGKPFRELIEAGNK